MNEELDIKTLRAIYTLSMAGSVTKAAERLQVTPAAISYLINKARKATGSALFFRTREGMKPNTLATELSQRYQNMMADYFPQDPRISSSDRAFVVSTYSLIEYLIALAWRQSFEQVPRLNFVSSHEDESRRLAALRNKEVDMDIGSRLPVDNSVVQMKLFTSDVGMIARKNHPAIGESFTTADWHQHDHVLWARGMHFISDNIEVTKRFHQLLDQQNIACVSSSSLNATLLCAHSDTITRMPIRLGRRLESLLPVQLFSLPENLRITYECYLHFHHSFVNDPIFQQVVKKITLSL